MFIHLYLHSSATVGWISWYAGVRDEADEEEATREARSPALANDLQYRLPPTPGKGG